MTGILSLDGVVLKYGALRAVDDVGFDVAAGEICALVGPNGSGKSSLLNTISGFSVVSGGRISLEDDDITTAPPHQVARRGVARSFQLVRLLPGLTVEDNVACGCYTLGTRLGRKATLRSVFTSHRLTTDMQERVDRAMERAGVAEYAGDLVDELAFGIQRRVEIARVLVSEPRVLLLDEPAAGLSEKDLEDLGDIIRQEAARGCAVVLVDHHLEWVLGLCPRAVVLNFGQKIFDGPSADAIQDPGVREAYVGV
jgi:ABC-type branched-subunit amino acid transport system ATPase component